MVSKNNVSPRTLSALTAIGIALPVAIAARILLHTWSSAAITFGIVFSGAYLLFLYMVERFIYRKIKLIYKFIHQTKASKKEETYYKYLLPRKSIDEVTDDVERWAQQRSHEIDLLKKNELFRKEFLQNLSHELKTPVFSIRGYVDALLQGAIDDEKLNRNFLEKASRNVDRLVNLLQDLDEISRLESGELKLRKQYFVVQDLIREVFEALSLKGEQKRISFLIKKGCEPPVTVFADKEKLRQVLANLVDNSVRYGRSGGSVIASIYKTDEKNVLVEIGDDGMGIPEKYLDRIFERFYRTAEGREKDPLGTGLGLSICKHIIEAHGHTIHVRSKEGVGTSIGFTLDTRKEQQKSFPLVLPT